MVNCVQYKQLLNMLEGGGSKSTDFKSNSRVLAKAQVCVCGVLYLKHFTLHFNLCLMIFSQTEDIQSNCVSLRTIYNCA